MHWPKEGAKASPTKAHARTGKDQRAPLHGRRPWSTSEHADRVLEGTKSRKFDREEHGEEVELTSAINLGGDGMVWSDGARRVTAVLLRRSLRAASGSRGEERGKWGRERRLGHGAHQNVRGAGGEEGDRGGAGGLRF